MLLLLASLQATTNLAHAHFVKNAQPTNLTAMAPVVPQLNTGNIGPAVGAGFAAAVAGAHAQPVAGKGEQEQEQQQELGLPGHGGPTGPIDKLHGGRYCYCSLGLFPYTTVRKQFLKLCLSPL